MSNEDFQTRKQKWYAGEQLVCDMYVAQWYTCLHQNYTVRGGEIDLIVKKDDVVVFVEVKVVDALEDVHAVVTVRKRQILKRTILRYMQRFDIRSDVRVDLVFVAKWAIIAHLENIVLT